MKNKSLKFKPTCSCGSKVSFHLVRKSWDSRDFFMCMCQECAVIGDAKPTFGWAFRAFKNQKLMVAKALKGKDNV